MRSATASTTRAATSTPPASCATGGPPAAAKAYDSAHRELGKQYDSYEPIPGTQINGQLTMGENIGDLGGLEMAYAAYRRHVAKHGEPPVIDGLTGDQRFFLAYGSHGRRKNREGALRQQLLTDPHCPRSYRVNGVVRNIDAWYKAFNVKPGDKLYLPPEQRGAHLVGARSGLVRSGRTDVGRTLPRQLRHHRRSVSPSNGLRRTGVSGQAAVTASLSE